jgi:hypothetical protein
MSRNIFDTLREAFEEVRINPAAEEIVILPPAVNVDTDEEEGNDENIFNEVQDVPGQLEVQMKEDEDTDSSDDSSEEDAQGVWRKSENPRYSMPTFAGVPLARKTSLHDEVGHLSPIGIFDLMWRGCDNLVKEESERYAHDQCNDHTFTTSLSEIRRFNGILLLSSYHSMPQQGNFWSGEPDLGCLSVKNAMPRNRFYTLKKYLHCADNHGIPAGPLTDRLFKLRPLYDLLGRNFMQWGYFHEDLSVDESMVPYFGAHSLRMFMRGKPVRFGYKNWCICSSTGYCYKFSTYQGAEAKNATGLPLGTRVVLDLTEDCLPGEHKLFFDNFFSNINLMELLRDRGIRATATIRDNRLRSVPPLTSTAAMKKMIRGSRSSVYDKQSELAITRWNDNNVVTLISNFDGIYPLKNVNRYNRSEKKVCAIPQPAMIANYNSGMGGVDVHDRLLSSYRINIKGECRRCKLLIKNQ